MNGRFAFQINPTSQLEIDAEIVGQLAIHCAYSRGGTPNTSQWMMSHIKSGCYFWEFDGAMPIEKLTALARQLAAFDFDAYFAGDCMNTRFVADVKAVIGEWERRS